MRRFTSSRSHETTSGRAVFSEDDAAGPWQADLPCAQISPGPVLDDELPAEPLG